MIALRLLYVLAFFSLTVSPVISQDVSVEFGEVVEVPYISMELLGCQAVAGSGYFLSLREAQFGHSEARVMVKYFDQNLKLKYDRTYQTNKDGSETVTLAHTKGKLAWFFTHLPKGEDNLTCYMATGPVGGDLGKHEALFEIPSKRMLSTPVGYMASPDSSKHVVYAIHDREDNEAKSLVNMAIMDGAFKKLWSKRVVLDYTERRLKALSWAALPNGDVCMLAKIYANDQYGEAIKRDGERVPDYKLLIFQFSKNEDKPKEYELKLGDLFVNGPGIFANRQNELACAGFYAKSHTGNSVGVFHLKLNPLDGSIVSVGKHDFSDNDFEQVGEQVAPKDKEGYRGLDGRVNFKTSYFESDGSVYLFAEDTYERGPIDRVPSISIRNASRLYYKNAVALLQLDAACNFKKIMLLPKEQIVALEGMGGFGFHIKSGKYYLIYNDHSDNLEKALNEKFKTLEGYGKNTVPILATITQDGKIKRKQLYDINSIMLPMLNSRVNDDQLLFVTIISKTMTNSSAQLGLINFKD